METRPLLEHLDELRNAPPPRDKRPVGCLLVLAALAAFVLFPTLARPLGLPESLGWTVLLLFGVLAAAGAGLALFGSGGGYGMALEGVEQAVAILTGPEAPAPETREFQLAATRLLALAHFSSGPTTVSTFDTAEMAQRLGPVLEGVIAVERALLEEEALYPVFTLEMEEPPGK